MIGSNENGKPDDIPFKADLTLAATPTPTGRDLAGQPYRSPSSDTSFEVRLHEHWRPLFRLLYQLYGTRYDFFYHVERVLEDSG